MSISQLENRRNEIVNRIDCIRNSPMTRQSAAGGMIHQGYEIRELENLDEELGKINAEIHKMTSKDESEMIQLIPYGHNHIYEAHSKGGILIKGGLLESYFLGRVISEHDTYVRGRHGKTSYTLTDVECIITPELEKDYTRGVIEISYFIDGVKYFGYCKYNSRVNNETYFYFALTNVKVVDSTGRGISETGKNLLKYVCAMEYRKRFKNINCNINLTDY